MLIEKEFVPTDDDETISKFKKQRTMDELLVRQAQRIDEIRETQREFRKILDDRIVEESMVNLELRFDDFERNEKSKLFENVFLESQKEKVEIKAKNFDEQSRWEILRSFRDRAVRKANYLQQRYDELIDQYKNQRVNCQDVQFELSLLSERLQRFVVDSSQQKRFLRNLINLLASVR